MAELRFGNGVRLLCSSSWDFNIVALVELWSEAAEQLWRLQNAEKQIGRRRTFSLVILTFQSQFSIETHKKDLEESWSLLQFYGRRRFGACVCEICNSMQQALLQQQQHHMYHPSVLAANMSQMEPIPSGICLQALTRPHATVCMSEIFMLMSPRSFLLKFSRALVLLQDANSLERISHHMDLLITLIELLQPLQ